MARRVTDSTSRSTEEPPAWTLQTWLQCLRHLAVPLCITFCVLVLFMLPGKVSVQASATIAFAPLALLGLTGLRCGICRFEGGCPSLPCRLPALCSRLFSCPCSCPAMPRLCPQFCPTSALSGLPRGENPGGSGSGAGQRVKAAGKETDFPKAEEFMSITAGLPWHRQAASNFMRAGSHFSRAQSMDAVTRERIFSPSEKEYLKQCDYADNLLEQEAATPIVNYLVWRRSELGLLVVLCLLVLLLACLDAMPTWRELQVEAKPFQVNYAKWSADVREQRGNTLVKGVDLSFSEFMRAYLDGLASQWAREMIKFKFLRVCLMVVMKAGTCCLVVAATTTWHSWKRSGAWILGAWAVVFAAPFVLSVVPLRAVTEMELITGTVPAFLNETMVFYGLDDTGVDLQAQLLRTCRKLPEAKEKTLELKEMQQSICKLVEALPKIDVNLVFKKIYANPDPAKDVCRQANAHATEDDLERLYDSMTEACDKTTKMMQDTLDKQNDLFTMIKHSMRYLGYSLDAVLGLMNAIMSSKSIWPAAMSLGPGLLKGALRAKAIVPQASVSGIFLILLPLLYVPFTWVMANILMQCSGSLLVLGALATVAFSPLGSSALSSRLGANMPMSREEYDGMAKKLGIWSKAAMLVSLLFVLAVILSSYSKFGEHLDDLYDSVRTKMVAYTFEVEIEYHKVLMALVTTGANFLLKLEMTTMATTDLMLRECALQRQFENLVAQADSLSPDIRENAKELEEGRTTSLNALVIAFGGKDVGPSQMQRRLAKWRKERFGGIFGN